MSKICIIGCGNIGSAAAIRLRKDHELVLYDRDPERSKHLSLEVAAKHCQTLSEGIGFSELLFLAVKPQNLEQISAQIQPFLTKEHLLISALAGVTTSNLGNRFKPAEVVRILPNLAMRYGCGIIAIADNSTLNEARKKVINDSLSPLGQLYWLAENKMDALTALTGSGPAFICLLIESIVDAGIHMGIDASASRKLTLQMIRGTVSMLEESGKHPAEVKWQTASPAGTTIAGLKKMEEAAVRAGLMNGFLAAFDRAKTLARISHTSGANLSKMFE